MKKSINILGYCLDMRVIVAITLVAAGIFVLAPRLFWTALPILAVLACTLSMLLMMRGMSNMKGQGKMAGMDLTGQGADQQSPRPAAQPRSREEQLRDLQDQLERVQSQQAAIASQIHHLSREEQSVGRGGNDTVRRN